MPNYTNSVSGLAGSPNTCQECSNPRCKGQDALRIFSSWNDLSAHMSEEALLHAINRLAEISENYNRLFEAEQTRKAAYIQRQTLKILASRLTPEQIAEGSPRPAIVTQPMRSRTKGGQNVL